MVRILFIRAICILRLEFDFFNYSIRLYQKTVLVGIGSISVDDGNLSLVGILTALHFA